MKTKEALRKALALVLPVLLLAGAALVPAMAKKSPGDSELRVAVISDSHVYRADMTDDFCKAFVEESTHNGRAIESTQKRFEAALADVKARAAEEKLDYLFVPGDMTEWSEYAGHVLVAGLLEKFEEETGIPVVAIPGNHDLELSDACDFSTGKKQPARAMQREEIVEVYAGLGYDLPNCRRYPNGLSYSADLEGGYRLIAADTDRWQFGADRISQEALRDWVLEECARARKDGKTIIGMGHHPLAEQMGNMDTFMGENYGFGDALRAAEAFADAGMHFYFSGHLHFNEIAMRVSDSGEPLYDIMTAATGFFPGGYRVVKLNREGKKITADVRTVDMPLTRSSPFPDNPYYSTLYGRSYGSPHGDGLKGWLHYAIEFALGNTLRELRFEDMVKDAGVDFLPLNALLRYLDERLFGQPERLLEILYGLADEIVAMPVSDLPCTYLRRDFGFGDPNKPGTFEDMGNCALIYLFGKRGDADKDPFFQDVLRRMQNGEFIDQLLRFVVPKVVAALGGEVIPLLMNNPAAIRALKDMAKCLDCPLLFLPLLALVVDGPKREALSQSLYHFASGIVEVQSPTGSPDGKLVYNGPVKVPTNPETFRTPQELAVKVDGLQSAKVTWVARSSAKTPEVKVTDKDGNPAPEVKVTITSAEDEVMAVQLDIGFAKLAGRAQPVLRHTARLTGLKPGKDYLVTAGDGKWGWWAEPRPLNTLRAW